MIIYIYSSSNRKSGGASSQQHVQSTIIQNRGASINFQYHTFPTFLKKLFCNLCLTHKSNFDNTIVIPILYNDLFAPSLFREFIVRIKSYLNRISSGIVISYLSWHRPSAIIFEYFDQHLYKEIADKFSDIILYSLLRSSPHCLMWSNSYIHKRSIINCLNLSDCIISASLDVYEMWVELLKHTPSYYNLPVPIDQKKLLNLSNNNTSRFSLFLICGNLGPRKGFKVLVNALKGIQSLSEIDVYIFGAQHGANSYLETSRYYLIDKSIRFHFLGYGDEFNICVNLKKSAFVFPSYSENQSRAHLEALKYDLPIFVNTKSISSEIFFDYKSRYKLFVSSKDLCNLLTEFINHNEHSGCYSNLESFDSNISLFSSKLMHLIDLHST